jgi:hypothetical protein
MQPSEQLKVVGKILTRDGAEAVPGALVELWDRDLLFDDKLGETKSDAQGKFEFQFAPERFADWFESAPDLYVVAYQGSRLIGSSRDAVLKDATTPAPLVLKTSLQSRPPPPMPTKKQPGASSAGGRSITPAEFGTLFIQNTFTAGMLSEEINHLLPERHFRQQSELKFGPSRVTIIADAMVDSASVTAEPDLTFRALFPVALQVRIAGSLGSLEVCEKFEVATQVPVSLRLRIYDTLTLTLEAPPVAPDDIALTIERKSWTEFTRGQVDSGVRKSLADRFNETLATSASSRNINILALIQDFLRQRRGAS